MSWNMYLKDTASYFAIITFKEWIYAQDLAAASATT